eukprot:gene8779-1315_t
MTHVAFVLLWTLLALRYSVQFSSPSSVANHRCRPVGGLSDGDIGTELSATARAPASAAGGICGVGPGLAVSPAMTFLKRLPGGGVALPAGFTPPAALAGARAVALSSVPMSPSLSPPTGLHLWFATDEGLLNWTEYRNASSVQSSTNATCVICPEDVPA